MRIGVLASGRGSNLQALLDADTSSKLGASIAVVLSDRKESAALERARTHGVDAVFVDPESKKARLRSEVETRIVNELKSRDVDWIVLAGFFRIVGDTLLDAFPHRILNIHPSLLPSFPGLHAQKQAIDHGVKVAGCTVHLVSAKIDEGPILAQETVTVSSQDTGDALAEKILEREHALLVKTVRRIANEGFHLQGRIVHWNETS